MPLVERLAAGALEDAERRRTGRARHGERRDVGADLRPLQAAEDAVLEREGDEHVAHAGDQVLVHRHRRRRRAVGEHRVEMLVERLALLRRERALERRVPVDADVRLERIGVELVRRVDHQVVLQRLVGLLEVVLVDRAQPLLEPAHDPRHQRVVEQVLVADVGGGVELVGPGTGRATSSTAARRSEVPSDGRRSRTAVSTGGSGVTSPEVAGGIASTCFFSVGQLRLDLGDVALVAAVAHRPADEQADAQQQHDREAGDAQAPRGAAPSPGSRRPAPAR